MNSRSKQVFFLLSLVVTTFFIAGLLIWQVNRHFIAEKELDAAETKWAQTYGDGRYDALKERLTECQTTLRELTDETASLQEQITSDKEKIAVEMKTVESILAEIHTVLEESPYSSLYDEYVDLQTRFDALSEKYNKLLKEAEQ